MERVLITGIAGFIGMHSARAFMEEGVDVIGIDNMNSYYDIGLKRSRLSFLRDAAEQLGKNFLWLEADLNSDVWEREELRDVDVVIHLAAQAGVRYSLTHPRAYLDSNILGFQSVLEFVIREKIEKFVYASSSSVYGADAIQPFIESDFCNSPVSYYAATKKANEMMATAYHHTHGLSSVGLRFFTVYGPWGRPDMAPYIFTKAAFENKEIEVYNYGRQARDFTFISDIVRGVVACARQMRGGAHVYNLGHGSPMGLMDFISAIERKTNRQLRLRFVEAQPGDVKKTFADMTNFSRDFGFAPKISLHEGVGEFVDWFRNYHNII